MVVCISVIHLYMYHVVWEDQSNHMQFICRRPTHTYHGLRELELRSTPVDKLGTMIISTGNGINQTTCTSIHAAF